MMYREIIHLFLGFSFRMFFEANEGSLQNPCSGRKVEGLIEPQWWSGETLRKCFWPRPSEGQKTPLSKKTLLNVLVYIQQFGSENIAFENAIIVIDLRTNFENVEGL